MVQLLLEGLGGDQRGRKHRLDRLSKPEIECFHVDAKLSTSIDDIGQARWGKLFVLLRYCAEAIWCRFRYGAKILYYVPAPALKSAIYRDWIVMLLCRPFFRRIIFHWHAVGLGEWIENGAKPLERFVTLKLLGDSDVSIVLGDFYRKDVARLRPKLTCAVPNGIPDPCPDYERRLRPLRAGRRAARSRLLSEQNQGLTGNKPAEEHAVFKVLYLSLCSREKGLFDAVEAVALANRALVKSGSPFRVELLVAGKFYRDSEQSEFEERIKGADLRSNGNALVRYAGFVSGEEKMRLFRESDCFCFPSYYPMEGHPVSLLEAMAFNLPIVATGWRALPELFPSGYTGLVGTRSPDEIAQVLRSLLLDSPEVDLRQRFLDSFLTGRFIEKMKSALQSADIEVNKH